MPLAHSKTRRAFSLLEMVLALAIGMVLLLALYVSFDMYIGQAQSGREIVNEAALARNILTRIGNDIIGQIGPVDPRVADYSTSGMPSSTPNSSSTTTVSYNLGVYGTGTTLVLSNYRVRKGPANAPTDVPDPVITSDVQRTAFWVVMNGSDSAGLARAEIRQATSPDSDTVDPTTLADQNKYIFAPEVKSITFQYYDGNQLAWLDTWDGTFSASTDGSSPPQGPPAAIRMTITLKPNPAKGTAAIDPNVDGPTYTHVVALPTSNSFPLQSSSP